MKNKLQHDLRALQAAIDTEIDHRVRVERNRCAKIVSDAADRARDSNRKKAAAELDLLARDIMEGSK